MAVEDKIKVTYSTPLGKNLEEVKNLCIYGSITDFCKHPLRSESDLTCTYGNFDTEKDILTVPEKCPLRRSALIMSVELIKGDKN